MIHVCTVRGVPRRELAPWMAEIISSAGYAFFLKLLFTFFAFTLSTLLVVAYILTFLPETFLNSFTKSYKHSE